MPKLRQDAPKSEKAARMAEEMHKFKHGQLHSRSKKGPVVRSRAQAIAIGLSESGQSRKSGRKRGRGRRIRRKASRGGQR